MRTHTVLQWPTRSDTFHAGKAGTLEVHDITAEVTHNDAFDNHLAVIRGTCSATGLDALIALHDTTLGPALGGCRIWHYDNPAEGLRDVLRLSVGMTYKAAMAGLPLGGGKAVINCDPHTGKSEDLLHSFGTLLNLLDGAYITAEDVGTTVGDMDIVAEATRYVLGRSTAPGGGDPSPSTAFGVLIGIQKALSHCFGTPSLIGGTIAIQGMGKVGMSLCGQAAAAGAKLIVADVEPYRAKQAANLYGARIVSPDKILSVPADIFAPCAMGGILNEKSIPSIRASIIAGSANNQLMTPSDGKALHDAGILYAPDYVINSGGLINAYLQMPDASDKLTLAERLEMIGDTLVQVFNSSREGHLPTNFVADRLAKEKINIARCGRSILE